MDALAAYGSDDDSSSNSDASQTKKSGGALSGLVDYSDDEGEVHDQDGKTREETEEVKNTASGQEKAPEASRKRKRDSTAQEELSSSASTNLPPPPLSDSSLVQWNTDYTAKYRISNNDALPCSQELVEKLNLLKQKSRDTSFAQELQSQKEFHNPHFFANVVSHFGIKESLGSTAAFHESFQPFEFNVVASEEHTRIRQQQQTPADQQPPSEFAQQQLEKAMRSNMPRSS